MTICVDHAHLCRFTTGLSRLTLELSCYEWLGSFDVQIYYGSERVGNTNWARQILLLASIVRAKRSPYRRHCQVFQRMRWPFPSTLHGATKSILVRVPFGPESLRQNANAYYGRVQSRHESQSPFSSNPQRGVHSERRPPC